MYRSADHALPGRRLTLRIMIAAGCADPGRHGCPLLSAAATGLIVAGTTATVPMLAEPTSAQRQAFDLIEAPIPLTLT
jgi:hypothetical protein